MRSDNKPEIAIAYVRVSSARQASEGLSLEAQQRTLTASAEAAGYQVNLFIEAGRSGKSITGRPEIQLALADLNAGNASALYVKTLDRLARNVTDLLAIIDMANKYGWRLVISDMGVDTATPNGRLMLTLFGGMAEFERGLISERAKDTHAERRARGIVWGVDAGRLPETSQEVRALVAELHDQGLSLRAIAVELTERNIPTTHGGKAWYASTISKMLKSPTISKLKAVA